MFTNLSTQTNVSLCNQGYVPVSLGTWKDVVVPASLGQNGTSPLLQILGHGPHCTPDGVYLGA